jgi:SRSO17 transposase
MAAITAPERTAAQHQSLLHFAGQGAWSDGAVLAKVREMVLPRIERHGATTTWDRASANAFQAVSASAIAER